MTNVDYDAMNEWNKSIVDEFRANAGRVGGPFEGRPMVLLTIKGRTSGKERTTPLVYLPDPEPGGERVIVFGSKAGAPDHPDWYKNLVANPDVELVVDDERRLMRARTASAAEKAELWPRIVSVYKGYDGYQRSTERDIPVVILEPRR